jgi:hypothetical protein
MAEFVAWRDRNGLPVTYAVRSGRRPEFGVQSYYSGNLKDGKFELDGVRGDIKSAGGLVLAAGSIHPSGEEYQVIVDAPIAPAPVVIERSRVKQDTAPDDNSPITESRNIRLTSLAGKMRNAGLSFEEIEAALLRRNEERCIPPLSEEEVKGIAAHVAAYPVPELDPVAVLGTRTPMPRVEVSPGEFEVAEDTPRPEYPDGVWNGTPYGDFADYCTGGTFIRKRFFTEAIRTVVGAVVGNQLCADIQGVSARAYTVLIGPPGSGKGTAVTAAQSAVECVFDSQSRSSEHPLLWPDMHDPQNWNWPSRRIGALVLSPASAPGMIVATMPHKLNKGESRNPMELWRGLPRFITIQEEIGGLFANFANENSGRALETAILELYEHDGFTTTVTNERSAKSGRLLYSLLGGIPKSEWDDIFSKASSVGSGLFSRLNIIGTENDRTVPDLPEYDFSEWQRMFLPRITALEKTPQKITLSPGGRALLHEWFPRLSKELKDLEVPSARLNTHAMRVALHLAWLKGHATMTEEDINAGIQVADFQAKMRDFYAPPEGESRDAIWEGKILKYMKAHKSVPYRTLQKNVGASRAGTKVWNGAIAGLVKDGKIAIVEETTKSGQTRKVVKLLKQKG